MYILNGVLSSNILSTTVNWRGGTEQECVIIKSREEYKKREGGRQGKEIMEGGRGGVLVTHHVKRHITELVDIKNVPEVFPLFDTEDVSINEVQCINTTIAIAVYTLREEETQDSYFT